MFDITRTTTAAAAVLAAAALTVSGAGVAQASGPTGHTTAAPAAVTEAGWEYAGKFATESQCGNAGRTGLANGSWFAWGCSHSPSGDPQLPWFLGVLR